MVRRFCGPFSRLARWAAGLLSIAAVLSFASLAGAASSSPALSLFGPWTAAGSKVVFVAKVHGKEGLWSEKFGSSTLERTAPAYCGPGMEEVDRLAVGPKGSIACLEATQGNTESFYSLGFVSASGAFRHVASAGGPTGEGSAPADSIPFVFGDGVFLGYLHVTAEGVAQLMQITMSGHARHVADLTQVFKPEAVSIDSGRIAVTEPGSVVVYATGGRYVSSFSAPAASVPSVGIRKDRIVVRTTTRRLAVYTLQGQLVHSYPLKATAFTSGLSTYGGYALYLGANKAVHAVKLTTGKDRIIARSGTGLFSGLSMQSPGAVAPLTSPGRSLTTKLVFIPIAEIRSAVG